MARPWTLTAVLVGLAALLAAGVAPAAEAKYDDDYNRQVMLVETHGFTRGRSVDIALVEAPGVQKLLAVVCKDSTLSLCHGFALDGKAIKLQLREPETYTPDSVFEAFFGAPYLSTLFGGDADGRTLKPAFTLTHDEEGHISLSYEFKDTGRLSARDTGRQTFTIRPKPRNLDFEYLFIGAEVKIGMADPVGSVSSF